MTLLLTAHDGEEDSTNYSSPIKSERQQLEINLKGERESISRMALIKEADMPQGTTNFDEKAFREGVRRTIAENNQKLKSKDTLIN